MKILVTGSAGYIGGQTCVILLEAGYDVPVIDNLCKSSTIASGDVQQLAGHASRFIEGDTRNPVNLTRAFEASLDSIIHFAPIKAVVKSCGQPPGYSAKTSASSH